MPSEKCSDCGLPEGTMGEGIDENCAGCGDAMCGNCYRKWGGRYCGPSHGRLEV